MSAEVKQFPLIDTNIFVADLLEAYEKDEVTHEYLSFFRKIPFQERIVTDFILGELETVVLQTIPPRYQLDSEKKQSLKTSVLKYFEEIRNIYRITTPPESVVKEAFAMYHNNFSIRYISFTDSLLLALAKAHHFTLLTKDQKIHAIAKQMKIAYYSPAK